MPKKYQLQYTEHALKDLRKCESAISKRILKKLGENIVLTDPLERAKALAGELSGIYRYRIGDYRVLFEINQSNQILILMVLRIRHRKDVYNI